uniref:Uncharacterized protein n=1 Tax=Steinernema glaseri TaxID=37863 RepID=A0A1I7YPQ7_9BILA
MFTSSSPFPEDLFYRGKAPSTSVAQYQLVNPGGFPAGAAEDPLCGASRVLQWTATSTPKASTPRRRPMCPLKSLTAARSRL